MNKFVVARAAVRRLKPVRWGSFRRSSPISEVYGFDRGTPIDRYYIRRFVRDNSSDITGDVLEVHDSSLTHEFGRSVTSSQVVDIDKENPVATLVADIGEGLPRQAFDCFLLVQTLQYIRDQGAALNHSVRSLRPGGTLLLTVPAISRIDPTFSPDLWRYTKEGLSELLARAAPSADIQVTSFGNPMAAIAFLMGLAAEEMKESELRAFHPSFPVVITARVSLKDDE